MEKSQSFLAIDLGAESGRAVLGSIGDAMTFDEAFFWTSTLEEACQIAFYAKLINEPFIEYRKMSESYSKF